MENKDDVKRNDNLFEKSRIFLETFSKGKQFIEEILQENERLRYHIVQLEARLERKDTNESNELIEKLQSKIIKLEEVINRMEDRYTNIENENKDFAEKYVEVEEQNNNLANLYVASYQLHSTLNFSEVVKIVMEIIINLIGAESFALYLANEKNELVLAASEEISEEQKHDITIGSGIIGNAAKSNESYYLADFEKREEHEPLAVIPLSIKEDLIGVLVIFELLQQKNGFSIIDNELFTLLAKHAATALFSSRLYSDSQRKFSTLKSFIELLKEE